MEKFVYTWGIIFLGLMLGYSIQKLVNRGTLHLPMGLNPLRTLLVKITFFVINPVTLIGALWIADLRNGGIATLPLLGIVALSLGGGVSFGLSKLFNMGKKQAGSFLVCGSFSNLGAIGGLLCYVFLGEKGFALVFLYKLFEEAFYFMVGFPIAELFSAHITPKESPGTRFRKIAGNPFIIVSTLSVLTGIVLNLSDLERWGIYSTINSVLIPLGIILLLTSIGLAMKIQMVRFFVREGLAVSGIKFLIVPAVVISLAYMLGYGRMEEGLVLKVVIVLSSMPVAFTSLIPPLIYDLDVDLANSCWLISMAFLVIVIPALYVIVQSF
jgi:predicted permease